MAAICDDDSDADDLLELSRCIRNDMEILKTELKRKRAQVADASSSCITGAAVSAWGHDDTALALKWGTLGHCQPFERSVVYISPAQSPRDYWGGSKLFTDSS